MVESTAVPRGAAGRADLVRALVAGGEAGLAATAGLLGYRDEGGRLEIGERIEREPTEAGKEAAVPLTQPGRPNLAPVPFWRIEEIETLQGKGAEKSREVALLTPEKLKPDPDAKTPPTAPIVPWSRLGPALHRALRSAVPSRAIDTTKLVERWSRGEIVRELPRQRAFAWSRRLTLLVDRSQRLIPFWDDQDTLARRLRRQLGKGGLRVVQGLEGPGGVWRGARQQVWRRPAAATGETVLALTDLGGYAGAATTAAWARLGRALQRAGARSHALVPCPASRWRPRLAGPWQAIDWSSPLRTAARGGRPSREELQVRCERLLTLVAPALRVEPGLLRAVRRLLPARDADIGTEADVWSHPEVDGGSSVAMTITNLEAWRGRFRELEEPQYKRAAVKSLYRWHAALPQEIWLEEAVELDAANDDADDVLPKGEGARSREHLLSLSRTVALSALSEEGSRNATELYFLRLARRLPGEAWDDAELRPFLASAWTVASRHVPDAPAPPGLDPATISEATVSEEPRKWTIWQVGAALEFRLAPLPGEEAPVTAGSPLVTLEAALPEIHVAGGKHAWARRCELGPEAEQVPLPRTPELILTTDRQRVTLRRYVRPPWAKRIGRDRFGLWAAFQVNDVTARLRWIPPGRFLMGSPETEEGRRDNEGPQHEEVLTHGFWLGDTPCTQALWEAVMGENLSEFRSPDRPVEQVSWDDCQEFHEKLNNLVSGLSSRLPTETEWEYACRAGTETSTYAGELEIRGERNAPLLDPIAWYGGNSGMEFELEKGWDTSKWPEKQYPDTVKAGTHPVARKLPNGWGLYDMLGNVWEWCADSWRENYAAEPGQDPALGSSRVIRGGSWSNFARIVRAAIRNWSPPGARHVLLGFRLARGQGDE